MRSSGRYPPTPWAAQRLYRPFLRAALLVALTLGFSTGALMLLARAAGRGVAPEFVQAHGFAQLFGWAGLAVMGVAFHVIPRFRGSPAMPSPWPQRAVLVLVVGAIALRWASAAVADLAPARMVLVVSGVLLMTGAVVFAAVIGGVLRRGMPSAVPFERWVWASTGWLVVAGASYVAGGVVGEGALDPTWNAVLIHAALFGFLGNAIFGVSLRAVANFAVLKPRRTGLERAAFAAMNVGIGLGAVALLGRWSTLHALGGLMLAAGLAAFIVALRLFERTAGGREARERTYVRWELHVTAAYAWLAVSAVFLAMESLATWNVGPAPLRGAPVLHLMALGFVTNMIVGFSARALPLFEGRAIPRPIGLDVAFVALNAAMLTRLQYGTFHLSSEGLAISGVLGLAGLMCFAVAIGPLLFARDSPHSAERNAAWDAVPA